jgi:hypothetical protein
VIQLGNCIERLFSTIYLTVMGAPHKPAGDQTLVDFFDTGVPQDYVKLLIQRHAPAIKEKNNYAPRQYKKLSVPDISTYEERFVPPRMSDRRLASRLGPCPQRIPRDEAESRFWRVRRRKSQQDCGKQTLCTARDIYWPGVEYKPTRLFLDCTLSSGLDIEIDTKPEDIA